ncbi:MAG: beta-galactosidase [Candidatus Acidiferrum sp.]
MLLTRLPCVVAICLLGALIANATEVPRIAKSGAGGQLVVNGKPYLILGGELGNSSAGTAAQADSILPQIARMHVNTVLMPVAWEQIEPVEGSFDFSILDHWMGAAREQRLHLVVLWFGSWKNGVSSYAPAWVNKDTKRYQRAVSADGDETDILSTLGAEIVKSDSRAFSGCIGCFSTQHPGTRKLADCALETGTGSNAAMDPGFVACAKRQSRRENLQRSRSSP